MYTDIRDEKSFKNKHTGTDKTESTVKDPNVKDMDDIFIFFVILIHLYLRQQSLDHIL